MSIRRLLPDPVEPVAWADSYGWPSMNASGDRSFVRANFVVSVDGAAAVTGRVGALSRPLDQALFRWLRNTADAVVVGAGTVRAERYGPVRVGEDRQDERASEGQAPVPPIVVVTGSCSLDWDAPVFAASAAGDGSRPIVVTTERAPAGAVERAREVAEVVVRGAERVDPTELLAELRDRGMRRVLTEGGPTLLAELWRAQLVDELCLTIAPLLVGAEEPRLIGPAFRGLDELELVHVLEGGGDLFLRYRRKDQRGW